MSLRKLFAALIASLALWTSPALAETTECAEITSIPATISLPGVYCFKQNLTTSMTSGNAITINANNVTLDLNGFKLGGKSAGAGTFARGVFAQDRLNLTIRNGNILGFSSGIFLSGSAGSGHVVEDIRADGNTNTAMLVAGENLIIRNNHIVNTGVSTVSSNALGIYVLSSKNSVISGNVIGGLSGTTDDYGVYIFNSSSIDVNDNEIFGLSAPTRYAINISQSDSTTIRNNRIINTIFGGIAIADPDSNSTGIDCIGNVIRGYTSGTTGCDYISGNHVN